MPTLHDTPESNNNTYIKVDKDMFKELELKVDVQVTGIPKSCHCGCDCNLQCEIHE